MMQHNQVLKESPCDVPGQSILIHPTSAEPNTIAHFDNLCAQLYTDLLRPYVDQLHTQPALTLSNVENLFSYALGIVRQRRIAAYEDFERRLRTRTIPVDACNFYACLAGSIIMCGSDDGQAGDANEIAGALVGCKMQMEITAIS